ncbi:hypothetical protein JXB12_04050 [candidate division KSB1 bacterium]|nr:hypothetical protein [candidate division KSB1 bacterium]
MSRHKEIDIDKIKEYSIKDRTSKVNTLQFASKYNRGSSLSKFIDSIPHVLKGDDLRHLVADIVDAVHHDKPIILMMGAHVIKCGLNPLIVQLIEKKIVSCIAFNGAGVIHDAETALWGTTSEDVAAAIEDGSFGMVRETPEFINNALLTGSKLGLGYGESVGKALIEADCLYNDMSIAANAYKMDIPLTVHVAIGTDIVHQHANSDGAVIGELSYRDFKIFAGQVARLERGGVVLNIGSAVILPEVFLKALTMARNIGHKAHGFTTANFDMIYHYRPMVNVVQRPTQKSGKGYHFTGHHEIMVPLLVALILENLS